MIAHRLFADFRPSTFAGLIMSLGLAEGAALAQAVPLTDADTAAAIEFRPRLSFHGAQRCWPFDFREIPVNAPVSQVELYKNLCRADYTPGYVVFASLKHPIGTAAAVWGTNTYRITYGVAFGKQQGTVPAGLSQDILSEITDIGVHGEDAQYVTVDVINGAASSVWADLHQGSYARVISQLTWAPDAPKHVMAYVGPYYNSLKLVQDTTTVCGFINSTAFTLKTACQNQCLVGSSCGEFDTIMNFGDKVGSAKTHEGTIVIVDHVCTAATEYVSPGGKVYNGTQLAAMKAYIGCSSTTPGAWSNSFKKKTQYKNPYGLPGCDAGNTQGGSICNASTFGPAGWTTFSDNGLSIVGFVVGNADVDYTAGDFFNDILQATTAPTEIKIRYDDRIKGVRVMYGSKELSHGTMTGSEKTLTELGKDPVVSVTLCEGSSDDRERAGYIKLVTQNGRSIEGGRGKNACKTIALTGKKLYGFYGRSGTEVDVLGTFWGKN